MKIVHVINNLGGAGAQNLVVQLAISQAKKHLVTVITVDKAATEYERLMLQRLQSAGVECRGLDREVGSGIRGISVVTRLVRLLKEVDPAVVNSHLEFPHLLVGAARMLATISGAKWRFVMTVHSSPEKLPYLTRVITREVPRVYCSQTSFDTNTGRPALYRVINNGVSFRKPPEPGRLREKLLETIGAPTDAKLVMTAGAVRPEKNFPGAIEAVALANLQNREFPTIHYLICGREGLDIEPSRRMVRECGADSFVHFLGLRDDVPELLTASDCYLSASSREGLPMAVLEAVFSGIPCVLSPIEPHCKVADGMAGCYLGADHTPAALANSLLVALHANQKHADLLQQRERQLQQYDIEVCADKYLDFYSAVVDS